MTQAAHNFAHASTAGVFWAGALLLCLVGCEEHVRPTQESTVANEAYIERSEAALDSLKQMAQSGDRRATRELANYYRINLGDRAEEAIYWELHAARLGDCEAWADLTFMVETEDQPVPSRMFAPGETLPSIGQAQGCAASGLQ